VILSDQREDDVRNSKTLSGGERMFSTVSLLLALWNCMEMPFRALDEFDVFMDSVTRKTSITLLIRAAREDADRQYIFITPHSVSDIPSASDIKVIKMHPPDRDQSIIVASQAQ
jgi:chromosome segregation ATPase